MRFTGKDVVVFGGSSGIGLAVAHATLEEGGSVCIASSRKSSVNAAHAALLAQYPKSKITARAVNVCDEDAVKAFLKDVGSFDHLIYTAGEDLPLGLIVDKDLAASRERFDIRYWGAIASAKHGYPLLRAGGSITLTSGFSSMHPRSGWTMQASIQSAVEGLTRALAVELAPIRVNAVSPGISKTPRWDSKSESERAQFYSDEEKRLPAGRVGEAAELAMAYLYLMENTYSTGTILIVDGGGGLL